MSTKKRTQPNTLNTVLRDARVRKAESEQGTLYAAADLVAVLTDSTHAAEHWADLKAHESALDQPRSRSTLTANRLTRCRSTACCDWSNRSRAPRPSASSSGSPM